MVVNMIYVIFTGQLDKAFEVASVYDSSVGKELQLRPQKYVKTADPAIENPNQRQE